MNHRKKGLIRLIDRVEFPLNTLGLFFPALLICCIYGVILNTSYRDDGFSGI